MYVTKTLMFRVITYLTLLCMVLSQTAMAATVTYFHNDALGSPVAATDEAGNVLWREAYRPFGERIRLEPAAGGNDLWYTAKPHEDELGLSYFGARWYDPALGRFTGIDPAGVAVDNVYSFNRYMYANDNPYVYVDPDGELPILLLIPLIIKVVDAGITAYDTYNAYQEGGVSGAATELGTSAAMSVVPGAKIFKKVTKAFKKGGVTKRGTTDFLTNVTIKSHGKVVGRGTVDLRGTLGDIGSGKLKPRDTFQSREGLLPKKPADYYQEFVHPTAGVKGAGSQRIIRGQGGELYYTPDHYESFVPLN